MKKRNHIVPAADDSVILIPEINRGERVENVVRADNADSDWRNALIGLAVFAAASVCVYYAFESLKVAVVLYIILAAVTILAVTGVWTVVIGVIGETIRDWKWASVEMERIRSTRIVLMEKFKTEQLRDENETKLKMAQIQSSGEVRRLREDVSRLQLGVGAQNHSWVNAKDETMWTCIGEWVQKLYMEEGWVSSSGSVAVKMPWNGEWADKPWKEEAQKWLCQEIVKPIKNERTGKPSHHVLRTDDLVEALSRVHRG